MTEYRETKKSSGWQECHECQREFRNEGGRKTYDWNGKALCPRCDNLRGNW